MPLTDRELELLEKEYFDQIYFYLRFNQQRMIWGLESKNDIRVDWWDKFTKSEKQLSEFARGTERIFYWLLFISTLKQQKVITRLITKVR
jgi:hypothetical protein